MGKFRTNVAAVAGSCDCVSTRPTRDLGEPVGEFRNNVAAVAGSCDCDCVLFQRGRIPHQRCGRYRIPDHVQFLSPDHLHELELGRHRLDRQRAQAPSSSTTSTAAQPSSKHKTTGFASALVMFQSHFGATPNPPWRDSSSILHRATRALLSSVTRSVGPLCHHPVVVRSFERPAALPLGHMLPPRSHGLRLLSSTGQENPRCRRRLTDFGVDKVRSTHKQLVCDWSEEVSATFSRDKYSS